MKKTRIQIQSGLILLLLLMTHLQSFGFEKIRLHLHTDRNYYVAGETVFFAMDYRKENGEESTLTQGIVFLELVDETGSALLQHKYALVEGRASGKFRIPGEVESRTYYLRAYAAKQKDAAGSFTHVPLLIIHPSHLFKPSPEHSSGSRSLPGTMPVERRLFRLEGLEKTYAPSDSIRIRLHSLLSANNTDKDYLTLSLVKSRTSFPGKSYIPVLQDTEEAKEDLFIKGRAITSTGKPVPDELILLSRVGAPTQLFQTRTGSDGSFSFRMDQNVNSGDLILQASNAPEYVYFTLEPVFPARTVPVDKIPPLPKDSLEEIFSELYVNARLNRIYEQTGQRFKVGSEIRGKTRQLHPFYGEADRVLILEDYIKLPVMEEIFRELGKRVFLERKKGQLQIRLLDLDSNRIIGEHPWFFLDGVPFYSSRKILEMNPADIHSIHIKSECYFLGEIIMDGIIDIRTHRADASLLELPPSVTRQYYHGVRSTSLGLPEARSHQAGNPPGLSATQLFITHPTASAIGPLRLSFPAPVLPGSYDLVIEGLDETGRPVYQSHTIHIK